MTPTAEMIKAAARAAYRIHYNETDDAVWESGNDEGKNAWRTTIAAALTAAEAVRPADASAGVGGDSPIGQDGVFLTGFWAIPREPFPGPNYKPYRVAYTYTMHGKPWIMLEGYGGFEASGWVRCAPPAEVRQA